MQIIKKSTLLSFPVFFGVFIAIFLSHGSAAGLIQQVEENKNENDLDQTSNFEVVLSSRNDLSPRLRNLTLDLSDGAAGRNPEFQATVPTILLPKTGNSIGANPQEPVTLNGFENAEPSIMMPPLIHSFEGINNRNNVQPPDTEGDIGRDPDTGTKYYMQWVNISLAVWDVTDPDDVNLLLGPANGNILFAGFGGPCETTNNGDPIVLFDHLANRWLASQFALPNKPDPPYYQCIAVSQTADPTGQWHRYEYLWPGDKLNDYPKFGVWPDGYYLSVNQFAQTGLGITSWAGAGVATFERDQMLAGNPARMVYRDLFDVNPGFGGLLPADLDGPAPPANTPNYFVSWDDSTWIGDPTDTIRLWEFAVNWQNPNDSTFGLDGMPNTTLLSIDVDPNMCEFSRSCIPQPNTTNKIDALSDRLMYRLQYRNFGQIQSLVTNHTVDVNGDDQAGIHWFELQHSSGNWSVHQEGVYAPNSENRWMASIASDQAGNMAMGYSVASGSTYPSIRYAGRLAGDIPGTLPQGESTLVAGTGSQTTFSNRWGDYSMMSIDPADDCTFWYTQQYYQSSGSNWHTRIGSFKFPACPAGTPNYGIALSPDGEMAGSSGSTITYTIHITNTGNLTDSYLLAQSGNLWSTAINPTNIDLAAGSSTDFFVSVDIPSSAAGGDQDLTTITATSQNDPATNDSTNLSTTALATPTILPKAFLPMVILKD